jgi:type IV secretion system protein VirD4
MIFSPGPNKNDFDLRELRKKPISIYINIPEREIERLSPLLTLFWIQLVDCLTVKEPDLRTEPYPVLALLDEFGNLSRVDKFRKGMSFLRSYRIVFVIILQHLGQLTSVYGRDDASGFLNTKVKMIFTLANKEDAKYFSDYMGQTTVKTKTRSISGGEHSRVSINEHEHLRPLLRPEEILRLPANDALIMIEGGYPVRAKKCFWFKDKVYRQILKIY